MATILVNTISGEGVNLNTSRLGEECQDKIYHWYDNHGNHFGEHYFRCGVNLNTSRLGEECQGKIYHWYDNHGNYYQIICRKTEFLL